jgi:hypothetical protein
MKHLFTLALFLFFSSLLTAQDSILVENHFHDGTLFDVCKKNPSNEKVGPYVQYSHFGKKFITGQYNKGVAYGIWNYYSSDTSGVLVQTLNFDTHTETYVDSNRVTSLICGPRYFGGRMAENEFVARRMDSDFSAEEKKAYKGQVYVVAFSIDPKTFKVVGVSLDDSSLPDPVKSRMMKIASDMPAWLPPVCKDKNEMWRFSIPIAF